ncbi:MAG: hypothetical protein WBK51_08430 [Polaromonas sp.]
MGLDQWIWAREAPECIAIGAADGLSVALNCVQTCQIVLPNSSGTGYSQNRDSMPGAAGFTKKPANPTDKPFSGDFDVQILLQRYFYTAGLALCIELGIAFEWHPARFPAD